MPQAWAGSHSRGFPTKTRLTILRRDPVCREPSCDQPSTEADHIIPVAQGGTDDEANGQGLCTPHHRAKTQREAQEAKHPRRRPLEPHPGTRHTA